MAYSSSAYQLDMPAVQNRALPEERPRVHVVPGSREQTNVSPLTIRLAQSVIALAVVAALFCFASIAFGAATVKVMMQNEQATAQIETLRSESTALKVQESAASAPTTVRDKAKALGMSESSQIATITLGDDVVKYQSDGSLSLTKTAHAVS